MSWCTISSKFLEVRIWLDEHFAALAISFPRPLIMGPFFAVLGTSCMRLLKVLHDFTFLVRG